MNNWVRSKFNARFWPKLCNDDIFLKAFKTPAKNSKLVTQGEVVNTFELDKLIYLDVEYISRKYEELTGISSTSSVSKQEGAQAGIKALFMNAGIHTQETRSYTVTSREMLQEIFPTLNKNYQLFLESDFKNSQGTQIVWVTGMLTIAEWRDSGSKEKGYEFFELKIDGKSMSFLSHKEYYATGFREIFNASDALKGNVTIPVRCLARIMWHVDESSSFTACPYVVLEV